MKIYIHNNPLYYNKIKYTLNLILKNQSITPLWITNPSEADIIINESNQSDFFIHIPFYQKLKDKKYYYTHHLNQDYFIRDQENKIDHLATIFYLINCVQEYYYPKEKLDHYKRFPLEASLQFQFKILERNIVQEIIKDLFINHPKLSKQEYQEEKSKVHLSHDIDYIHDPIKREIKWAVKKKQIKKLISFVTKFVLKKSIHFPYQEINQLHEKFNFNSTYFYISNNGIAKDGIKNGDYHITEQIIRQSIEHLKNNNQSIGLHKSTFNSSINQELELLNIKTTKNRNHYLKFELPNLWKQIETSSIEEDYSLGFGKHIGFRNSYGKAFIPFDLEHDCPFSFKVYPLHIMDSSFMYYSSQTAEEAQETITQFINKHQFNCDLSIVWHNTSFTSYSFSTYLELYKSIINECIQLGLNN